MALVLVVEDDPSLRAMYELVLPLEGHVVVTAGDGASAVAVEASAAFDVIVMDLQLPDMHGYQALRRIKESRHGESPPAIVLTGSDPSAGEEQEPDLGVRLHLMKPFEIDALVSAIAFVTGERALPRGEAHALP